jgi:hypothetical protein
MARIKVGKPDVKMDKPTHVAGVRQGNAKGSYDSMAGHHPDGRSSAERSTGINPKGADPIDPRMPNLSPA